MVRPAIRLAAVAIAPQVRQHDGELFGELGGNLVPGDVRLGMAVQQQQRWPLAADQRVDRRTRDLGPIDGHAGRRDEALPEAGEEERIGNRSRSIRVAGLDGIASGKGGPDRGGTKG